MPETLTRLFTTYGRSWQPSVVPSCGWTWPSVTCSPARRISWGTFLARAGWPPIQQRWPRWGTGPELRSFLCLASYYRRFVRDFATIASFLHQLTNKGRWFGWSENCAAAFWHYPLLTAGATTARTIGQYSLLTKHFSPVSTSLQLMQMSKQTIV